MWFGLPDANNANETITKLAGTDHQTDWGMRIISNQSKVYDGSGYHYGAVWPLFTGWASVGEYRYHRAFSAYANLRSNALLGVDGSLGHFTEVLSGDYYQSFATSSPHQIWSAAMVISPILRGMFGLQVDAEKHQLTLEPHVPADWTSFAMHNIRVGEVGVDLRYHKTHDSIVVEAKRNSSGDCRLQFSPALSLRTQVDRVELNGRPITFKLEANSNDQHLLLQFPLAGSPDTVVIRLKRDFGLTLPNELPPLGSASRGLRVISESWNAAKDQLTLSVSGRAGDHYELEVWNPTQVLRVEGATLGNSAKLQIQMPPGTPESYTAQTVTLHFTP
jgi:hypothetical protein